MISHGLEKSYRAFKSSKNNEIAATSCNRKPIIIRNVPISTSLRCRCLFLRAQNHLAARPKVMMAIPENVRSNPIILMAVTVKSLLTQAILHLECLENRATSYYNSSIDSGDDGSKPNDRMFNLQQHGDPIENQTSIERLESRISRLRIFNLVRLLSHLPINVIRKERKISFKSKKKF